MNNRNTYRETKAVRRPEDTRGKVNSKARRVPSSEPVSKYAGRYNVRRDVNVSVSRNGSAPRRNGTSAKQSASYSSRTTANRYGTGTSRNSSKNTGSRNNPISGFVSFLKNDLLYGRLLSMDDKARVKSEERQEKEKQDLVKYDIKENKYQASIIRTRSGADTSLLIALFIILACGIVTVYSATYPTSGSSVFVSHIRNIVFGLAAGGIMYILPMSIIKNIGSKLAYLGSLVLLILILIPGVAKETTTGNVQRWIAVGPLQIQPSELMKFSMILMLAWYYDRFSSSIWIRTDNRIIRPLAYNIIYPGMIGITAIVLVYEGKHLSGAIILCVIFAAILFAAKTEWKYIGMFAIVGLLLVSLYLINNDYAQERFMFLYDDTEESETVTEDAEETEEEEEEDPNAAINDNNRQSLYSKYAIGSGGLWGKGIGNSRIKNGYLFGAHTDFIFAIVAEEGGFLISCTLILLYLFVVYRGAMIAITAPNIFTMLVATGITAQIGVQAWLNIFVSFGVINTGVGLPFFSYGGSSMLVMLAEAGLLLKISKESYIKQKHLEHEDTAKNIGLIKED